MLKRIFDTTFSLFGLIILLPFMLIIAIFIKLDSKGPIFFKQLRVTKNGREFKILKYRTMRVGSDKYSQITVGKDERITKIGSFLRKYKLDEIPQLINVLIGDMSLVGTRPPTVDEYEKYTPEQKKRLSFKPGITGLWQVSGRSEITNFDDVVKLDVSYIDDWTIWSDIKILLKTVKVVLMKDGAK